MEIINAWSRYFVELLSRLVCQLKNIVPHTSLHDQTYHKNMEKEYFEGMVISLFHPLKFAIRTYMIQEKCWFFQVNFFVKKFPHWFNIVFLSSQFYVIHTHKKEQCIFQDEQRGTFPIWNFLPSMSKWDFLKLPFPF